ncbi:MAG: FlgD immunoglobulin-like domain containing protein [Bacteroidota bacterium]
MRKTIILAACFVSALLHAQTPDVTIDTVSNYNSWVWKAIVMQNGLITHATVPAIGGRVMQYDLGSHPSIFINSVEKGKTYIPSQGSQWHNFGGYRTAPAPQSRWPNTWPPPPKLDYGNYSYQIVSQTADSVSALVTSPVESWIAPNIQFQRKATMYLGSSHVKMEQTMINQGAEAVSWSMWSIVQSIVNHSGQTDYSNFWVYFPINPSSRYGTSGVYYSLPSNSWKGEVAPGIYGVQCVPASNSDVRKIYSDSHKGWIAYTDRLDSVVYARTFDIFEEAEYPDDGSRSSVYVSPLNPPVYMEVEVTGPIVELAGGGGSYTFTENWWAAKMRAPVLDVNTVGAIAGRLSYDSSTQTLSAVYGVFHKGTAKVVFTSIDHQIVAEGEAHDVTPLQEFQFQEIIAIPEGAATVEIRVYNSNKELVGVLDSASVSQFVTAIETKAPSLIPEYRLESNYPNPFNPTTTIAYTLPKKSSVEITIYDTQGQIIKSYTYDTQPAGQQRVIWDGTTNQGNTLSNGVYMYRVRAISMEDGKVFDKSAKMILLK